MTGRGKSVLGAATEAPAGASPLAGREESNRRILLVDDNPAIHEDIRKILTTSAKHPGDKQRDDDFGSGLVDPSKAIQDACDLKAVRPARR